MKGVHARCSFTLDVSALPRVSTAPSTHLQDVAGIEGLECVVCTCLQRKAGVVCSRCSNFTCAKCICLTQVHASLAAKRLPHTDWLKRTSTWVCPTCCLENNVGLMLGYARVGIDLHRVLTPRDVVRECLRCKAVNPRLCVEVAVSYNQQGWLSSRWNLWAGTLTERTDDMLSANCINDLVQVLSAHHALVVAGVFPVCDDEGQIHHGSLAHDVRGGCAFSGHSGVFYSMPECFGVLLTYFGMARILY